MIAEGVYKARAVSMTVGKSSKKGTPGVTVVFRLGEGPSKDQFIEWQGYITEGSRDRTIESLDLCGFDGTDPKTITLKEVSLVIAHESFTSEKGNLTVTAKVQWINDPTRGGAKMIALDPAEESDVMADLRGLVLSHKAAKKTNGTGAEFPHGANVAPAPTATVGTPPKF